MRRDSERRQRLAWRLWFAAAALTAALLWFTAPGRREWLLGVLGKGR